MSHVEFDGVSVRYRTQREGERALDGVDLEIDRGEFVGVVGPSEAGKSTLLRAIASYVPNYFGCDLDGTVTVDGTSVAETTIGEHSAKVGLLFENPFDQLTGATTTVVEEVAYGLENQGLPREEIVDRTYESLERVGIVPLMDRNPYDLSGGQSQRVALASVLALEPEILLLDEPTSQLDPSGTEAVFDVVDDMATGDYTTVVVSQDLDRLAPLVDRLLVVEDGRIRADDDPRSVLTDPIADEDLFFVPEVVRIGTRLRDAGRVDPGTPVPLRREEALAELRDLVAGTGAGGGTGGDADGVSAANGGDAPASGDGALAPGDGAPAPEDDAPIVFEDVRFAYDDEIEALRGVSLSIDGGCTCLIGQNGAGKSTFAKHLNGLLKPTAGRVTIAGHDTRERRVAQLARHVGLSFQNPDNQLFNRSVAREVRYGPSNLGYDEERVDALAREAIDRMALGDVTSKNPYDLGLAGRKRVAVASVLAMDTDVVVLDEPTGGQDVAGTELLGDAVEALAGEGKTVVVVTHDVPFVRDHADRVIALCEGEVLLDGDPRNVFAREADLAHTEVHPPEVTRIGSRLGLDGPVLSVDELFASLG